MYVLVWTAGFTRAARQFAQRHPELRKTLAATQRLEDAQAGLIGERVEHAGEGGLGGQSGHGIQCIKRN